MEKATIILFIACDTTKGKDLINQRFIKLFQSSSGFGMNYELWVKYKQT